MPQKKPDKAYTPLKNDEAEQSIIGGALWKSEYAGIALRLLTPACFYNAWRQNIFRAIKDLWDKGSPIDLITVDNALRTPEEKFELLDCNHYDHRGAHIDYYSKIVRDLFLMRRTRMRIETGLQEITETKSFDIGELLGNLTDDLLTYKRQSEYFNESLTPAELTDRMLVDIDSRKDAFDKNEQIGIPTGWEEFDRRTSGLEPGDTIILAGRPSMGKCLGKGTKVVMFNGELKNAEDIIVGDLLMGVDSKPRKVLSINHNKGMMYWIRQNFGLNYRVNGDHVLSLKRSKNEKLRNHGEIKNISVKECLARGSSFLSRWKGYKVAIEFPERKLPIDPYFMGLWLGDGSSYRTTIHTADIEVKNWLNKYAHETGVKISYERVESLLDMFKCQAIHLSGINSIFNELYKNKHIPENYLFNSKENRLKLLAGLIDSDGYYDSKIGCYEIVQKNQNLAMSIYYLCNSLGYGCSIKSKTATIKNTGFSCVVWRIRFRGDTNEIPIKVKRKMTLSMSHRTDKTISGIKIEQDKVDDYYGFKIDGDGLFLLEDMTVTHNSDCLINIMNYAALSGYPGLIITLEMSAVTVWKRVAALHNNIYRGRMRDGRLSDAQVISIHQKSQKLRQLPLSIVDKAQKQIRLRDIRSLALEQKHKTGLKIMGIDYIGLITPPKSFSREREVAQISAGLKSLAQELQIPIIIVSQLSRGLEMRDSRRPRLSDLRDSGSIEQDADMVMLIYRSSYYSDIEKPDKKVDPVNDKIDIDLAKNRNGEIFAMLDVPYNRAIGRVRDSKTPESEPEPEIEPYPVVKESEPPLPF